MFSMQEIQEIQDIRPFLCRAYQNYENLLDSMVFEFNAVVSLGILRPNLVLAFANQNLNRAQRHHDYVATRMEYFILTARLLAAKKLLPVAPVVADLSEEHNTTVPPEETEERHNTATAPQEMDEHDTTAPPEKMEKVHNTATAPQEMEEHHTTAPSEKTEEVHNTATAPQGMEEHNTLTPEEIENLEVLLAQLHNMAAPEETDNQEVLQLKALLAQLTAAYKNYEEETGPAVTRGKSKADLYQRSDSKIVRSTTINTSGPIETVANLYAGLLIAYQHCESAIASLVAKHDSAVLGGIMDAPTALKIAIENIFFVQYYFQTVNTVGWHFGLIAVLMTLTDPTPAAAEPEVTEEEFNTLMRLHIGWE